MAEEIPVGRVAYGRRFTVCLLLSRVDTCPSPQAGVSMFRRISSATLICVVTKTVRWESPTFEVRSLEPDKQLLTESLILASLFYFILLVVFHGYFRMGRSVRGGVASTAPKY